MKILLVNDDGIRAEGLWALYKQLQREHDVTVVAPDRERSAVGHAITLHLPIRVEKVSINGGKNAFAVTGTPADCIKLAMGEFMEVRPDLVISGINPGANIGVNINYSGTLAAAREATLYGVPAIAVSIQGRRPSTYGDAAAFIGRLAQHVVHTGGLPRGTLLNVNIPDRPWVDLKGIRLSRQSSRHFIEAMERRLDPRNRAYYWYGIGFQEIKDEAGTDSQALADHYIAVTPIKCDTTDYELLDSMQAWDIRI